MRLGLTLKVEAHILSKDKFGDKTKEGTVK